MTTRSIPLLLLFMAMLAPAAARAHCDTLAGPVAVAAERSLAAGRVRRGPEARATRASASPVATRREGTVKVIHRNAGATGIW